MSFQDKMLSTILPCLDNGTDWEQARISREIERRLSAERTRKKREVKILLLGTSEAGKTTLIRQMTIIHGSGYNEESKLLHRTVVIQNVYSIIKAIIQAMEKLDIPYSQPNNEHYAYVLSKVDSKNVDHVEDAHRTAIRELWKDDGVQECLERDNDCNLPDSTRYYLDQFDRICLCDYVPIEQDILRLRAPTTGINEYPFDLGNRSFRMVDVGGQRSERRKWLHCFEGVESVIFVAAASEFDQKLQEDKNEWRLQESTSLFKVMLEGSILSESSFILFVNKQDRLEEKLKRKSFKQFCTDFSGDEKDIEQVTAFITASFVSQVSNKENIFPHHTTATDTENIKHVFSAVRDTILEMHMKKTVLG